MKRSLLAFLLLAIVLPLSAQDVTYYSEDFNGGPNGWTVNTYLCEGTTGQNIGLYTLSSGTYNNQPISGLSAELSIYTDLEYTLQFEHASHFGYSQGQFTVDGGTFNSSLTGATFDLDSTIYELETNGRILYTSQLNISQELFDQWGRTLTGAGSPTFNKSGNNLTLTSSDGLTVLNFQKTSDCGKSWIWHPDGQVGYGSLTPEGTAIVSETNENGVMSLNADWLSTLGDINNLPDGPLPDYESELISPSIDLSDAGGPVYLRFNELLLYWPEGTPNSPRDEIGQRIITSVSYSIDGGENWIDSINVNENVKYMEPVGTNFFNLFPFETRFIELPMAAGQSDVKVKFNWLGTIHYWVVDDITIQSAPESNVSLGEFIWYPAANYQQPLSQIGLDTMDFFATVTNRGVEDLTNVRLRARVFDPAGALVFNDSLVIDVLPAGYQDSLLVIPGEYIPDVTDTEDEYLVLYTVSSDSIDVNFTDNYEIMYFRAHPDTYAKDDGGEIIPNGAVFETTDYQMGCYYELDPLAGNGIKAASAFYSVIAFEPYQNNVQILTNLYEIKDRVAADFSNFNLSSNGTGSEDDDLEIIALGEASLPAGERFGDLTVELGDIDDQKVELKPGGRYFLANLYSGQTRSLVHQIDSDIPYLLRIPVVYYRQDRGQWFTGMFFYQDARDVDSNVPVMHLTIQFDPTSTDEQPLPDAALNIYPNPTVEQISVDVDLEKRGPGLVFISDSEGKILLWQRYESLQKETLNFNVQSYPAGNYFLRLGTEEGTKTLPFVVVKE